MTLGPLIAVYFCREAERKGIKVDFVLAMAAVYAAHSVWQYGLSSSAPLLVATPGHFLENVTGRMPLATTIWTPAAIVQVVAFVIGLLVAARYLMPKEPKTISEFPEAYALAEEEKETAEGARGNTKGLSFSQRLERSLIVGLILVIGVIVWLY